MNQRTESHQSRSSDDVAMDDLINETRSLQRRVSFWQRTAWLLLGAVVIFMTVLWQRGELRRRECRKSMEYFAMMARKNQLAASHLDMLERQWQFLEQGPAKVTPIHYDLIVKNWAIQPKPDELIPRAVCRESHFLALSRGRHVLLWDGENYRVEWRSEDAAEPVVREATSDNRAR